jgi:hypothetical protein
MNINQPAFRPVPGATVALACSTSSSNVQAQAGSPGAFSRHYRIYNSGSVPVFIEFGASNAVAAVAPTPGTPGGMAIGPGQAQVFAAVLDWVAGVTASGTATLYITPGEGR